MRIAFLTSGLEPGRDGVGDYTRELAGACVALGHDCSLLALNDGRIECSRAETQNSRAGPLDCLRLPASESWVSRVATAREWLEHRQPDWISLQLVIYGYHPRGLIEGLHLRLAPLIAGRRAHLMLHELWIGMERGASLKHRITGAVQRRGLLGLIRRLKPQIVHTSNPAYAAVLARYGVQARMLPLCGNIPVLAAPDSNWLDQQLMASEVEEFWARPPALRWRFGLFGSLHAGWSYEPLFQQVERIASRRGRDVIIASIGRRGSGDSVWRGMESRYARRFRFAALGERSAAEVSMFLQSVDFGLAATPWQLIGKSGAVAAMIDHGLPVIVSRNDVDYGVPLPDPSSTLLYRMGPDLDRWLLNTRRQAPRPRLSEMTVRFLEELSGDPLVDEAALSVERAAHA